MKQHISNYNLVRPSLATQSSAGTDSRQKRRGPALSQASRQSRLEQSHWRELREFDTFQQHIRQLMQNRHTIEELSLEQKKESKERLAELFRQQARERNELQQAQALSLQLLKDRQVQEKADLLSEYS
jgi:hypothetical protein